MDPTDYRDQVLAAVQAAQPSARAASIDTSADARTQAGQILSLGAAAVEDAAIFAQLLQRLGDASESTDVRTAIIRAIQMQRFLTDRFDQRAADWTAALRQLTNAADLNVRISAIGCLVNSGDTQVQDQLVAALQSPGPNAIALPVVALQLLGNDVHSEVFPLARQFVDDADTSTRLAALRILASDAGSVGVFTGLLANAQESSDVRILSLAALNSLAPDTLVSSAASLVRSGDSNPDVVAASLIALATTSRPLPQDLAQAVGSLAGTAGNGGVQVAAIQLQNRMTSSVA